MRLVIVASALSGLVLAGVSSTAPAGAVEFSVGPGGVHVGRDHRWRDRDHRWRDRYDQSCRVIIDHHTNRWGERVTVRRHVCD
jgi:hypothetical protein